MGGKSGDSNTFLKGRMSVMKKELQAANEYMSHLSTFATCGPVTFKLVQIRHMIESESSWQTVQNFWPLDLDRIRLDMHISLREQTTRQRIDVEYSPLGDVHMVYIHLMTEDGTNMRAEYTLNDTYRAQHEVAAWPCPPRQAVTAKAIETIIETGDLDLLKRTVKTANHLNMGAINRPIHMAIDHNRPRILEWLLAQPGTDVNKTPFTCSNIAFLLPLTRLASFQQFRIGYLCTLIRAGMSIVNDDGSSVFHHIASVDQTAVHDLFCNHDVVAKLMEYAICALEPSEGHSLTSICSGPDGSADIREFLVRAASAVRTLIIAHVTVDALVNVIVAYISG